MLWEKMQLQWGVKQLRQTCCCDRKKRLFNSMAFHLQTFLPFVDQIPQDRGALSGGRAFIHRYIWASPANMNKTIKPITRTLSFLSKCLKNGSLFSPEKSPGTRPRVSISVCVIKTPMTEGLIACPRVGFAHTCVCSSLQ